jgi:hypothetical protein
MTSKYLVTPANAGAPLTVESAAKQRDARVQPSAALRNRGGDDLGGSS